MNRYPLKKYPMVGACGLDCGLCSRYYTEGPSRCPGCCGPDFWEKHPGCAFITCCVKRRNLEHSKSFYCTSCQLIPLDKLKEALTDAEVKIAEATDIKEKARIVRVAISNLADTLQIDLRLRK